jgi:hypothetical protein
MKTMEGAHKVNFFDKKITQLNNKYWSLDTNKKNRAYSEKPYE